MSELLVERRGDEQAAVVWLTLNRPEKLNALNSALLDALVSAFGELAGDESVRAVVLTGAGDRAFAGGADIGEMAVLDSSTAEAFVRRLHDAMEAARDLPVPVIARIDGHCLGGAMELAASCDLRVATERSRFGMPEVHVGLPSVIEAALLPRLMGWGRSSWLLYTGEVIDAATAADWGFVEKVVPGNALDDAVAVATDALVAAGPKAVLAQKALMREWERSVPDAAIEAGVKYFVDAYNTGEPQRMMGAFLESKKK